MYEDLVFSSVNRVRHGSVISEQAPNAVPKRRGCGRKRKSDELGCDQIGPPVFVAVLGSRAGPLSASCRKKGRAGRRLVASLIGDSLLDSDLAT